MERELIRWMCRDVVSFREWESASGVLTSGGSLANMMAIAAARDGANLRCDRYFFKAL